MLLVLVAALAVLLAAPPGARSQVGSSCSTWEDVTAPYEVAHRAVALMESSEAPAVFSSSLRQEVESASRAITQCAASMFVGRQSYRDVLVTRHDAHCPTELLSEMVGHNLSLLSDPCCTPLQSQCCVERSYWLRASKLLYDVQVDQLCRRTSLIKFLLSRVQGFEVRRFDGSCEPSNGVSLASYQAWQAAVERCLSPPSRCTMASHCVSGLCLNGQCVSDAGTPDLCANFLRCVASAIPEPRVASQLRLVLGLSLSATEGELLAAFEGNTTREGCYRVENPSAADVRLELVDDAMCDSDEATCEDEGDLEDCDERSLCVYSRGGAYDLALPVRTRDGCEHGYCLNPLVNAFRCTGTPFCSVLCNGFPCATQGLCEEAGFCENELWVSGEGACVFPFDKDGACLQANTLPSPLGCILQQVGGQGACTLAGGDWKTPKEPARTSCLTQPVPQCTRERQKRNWSWKGGVWDTSSLLPTVWRRARVIPKFERRATMSHERVRALFNQVFNQLATKPQASVLRCQHFGLMRVVRAALCECSQLSGRPEDENECWDDAPIVISTLSLVKGTGGSLHVRHAHINWFATSCDSDRSACDLEVGEVLRRMSIGESVYARSGELVGATVSEPIFLHMGSNLGNGLELCLDVAYNASDVVGHVPAIVVLDEEEGHFERQQSTVFEATFSLDGSSICRTVLKGGTYSAALVDPSSSARVPFPVMLMLLALFVLL